jgi:hypothetical protein
LTHLSPAVCRSVKSIVFFANFRLCQSPRQSDANSQPITHCFILIRGTSSSRSRMYLGPLPLPTCPHAYHWRQVRIDDVRPFSIPKIKRHAPSFPSPSLYTALPYFQLWYNPKPSRHPLAIILGRSTIETVSCPVSFPYLEITGTLRDHDQWRNTWGHECCTRHGPHAVISNSTHPRF